MTTRNQQWARLRNFTKFRLRGIYAQTGMLLKTPRRNRVLTDVELIHLRTIDRSIAHLLREWERRNPASKSMYTIFNIKLEVKNNAQNENKNST